MDRTGLVARFYGPADLRVEREPVPDPGPGQAVVRMIGSGICGSDVHAVRGDLALWPPPIILGHEGVGIVEQLGEGAAPAATGQLVSVCPSVSCGTCFNCREGEELLCSRRSAHLGAFADYCTVPLAALYPVPTGVSWRSALFTEPLACVLHALSLSGIRPGESVAIIGGGTIGMLLTQVARLYGAHVLLSEPDASRRAMGIEMGADEAIDPRQTNAVDAAMRFTGGVGIDRVVEAVGLPSTIDEAVHMARRGGSVVVMGVAKRDAEVAISPYELYERQLTVRGSFIRNFDFQRAVRLLDRLRLEALLSEQFELDRIHEAIDCVASGRGLKTIVVTSATRTGATA